MSILFDGGGGVPLGRPSALIAVFRYHDDLVTDERFELLPHVVCLAITFRAGADPGVARFRYAFMDPSLAPGYPSRIEHCYPYDATGSTVVKTDDRLIVRAYREDGYSELLFDGFVQVPQADLDADAESVSFIALGTPIREWDTPLSVAVFRNADAPENATENVETGLPIRFNPDGNPNASPLDHDAGDDPNTYPVFLGPVLPANEINGATIRKWTLAMAARYIVMTGASPGGPYVSFDDISYFDEALQAILPSTPGGTIDLGDSSTYDYEDVDVQDIDVTGQAWPEALQRLIEPHGFSMRFELSEDTAGDPQWTFRVYRTDLSEEHPLKPLALQPVGESLDPAFTNLGGLALARDAADVVNRYEVDTAPTRYESSFILAWKIKPLAADVNRLDDFKKGPDFTGDDRDAYRTLIFDECGEGHYDRVLDTIRHVHGYFDEVLNPENLDPIPFVRRRRPALPNLISTDAKAKPFRAELAISFNYAGEGRPHVWDGTGDWRPVTGWRLLEDRLGVYIDVDDPNSWSVTTKVTDELTQIANNGGKINLVEWVAAPNPGAGKAEPRFRLTCVIEGDQGTEAIAKRRAASTTSYTVARRIDGRDRYRQTVICTSSAYAVNLFEDEVVDDPTEEAAAYANAMRRAHEAGAFAGTATIPRLSTAYRLGDQITGVVGRGLSLRQNLGGPARETAVYPAVVAITWDFDGKQSTTLELSDRRAEPAPKRSGRVDE